MNSSELDWPSVALFDWDSTLVDNWSAIAAAINHVRARHGKTGWSLAEVLDNARHPPSVSFAAEFGADAEPARAAFLHHLTSIHLDHLTVLPGVEALLDALAGQGVRLGIVTNKTPSLLHAELAALGWSPRFDACIAAGEATADKPDPAPIHLALRRIGAPANRKVWMVGDSDLDIRAGRAAGCLCVLVRTNPAVQVDAAGLGADVAVQDCVGLLDLLAPP